MSHMQFIHGRYVPVLELMSPCLRSLGILNVCVVEKLLKAGVVVLKGVIREVIWIRGKTVRAERTSSREADMLYVSGVLCTWT
jgi:hypothetical protein